MLLNIHSNDKFYVLGIDLVSQPGDANVYESVADARGVLATAHQLPQSSKAALLIENCSLIILIFTRQHT